MTTTATPDVREHVKALTDQLARCDSKAAVLLALTGASLAGAFSVAASTRPGPWVLAAGGLGAGLLLAATLLLLAVVRPRLDGPGFPRWPGMPDEELRQALAAGPGLEEARVLAALAVRKFQRVRAAVDCARAGITLLALAAGLAITI